MFRMTWYRVVAVGVQGSVVTSRNLISSVIYLMI
jgi:hypothetical protein